MDSPADATPAAPLPTTWRPPPPTVTQQSRRTAGIIALATRALAAVWPRIDWTDPDTAQHAVLTYYRAIVTRFGQSAAAIAAENYDQLRAAHDIRSKYIATPAATIPDEQIAKIVTSAFLGKTAPAQHNPTPDATPSNTPRITVTETPAGAAPARKPRITVTETPAGETPTHKPRITTSELPTDQRVQQRLTNTLPRLVIQPARDTVALNTERDPDSAGWIRVPTGPTTCAFCIMLASREPRVSASGQGTSKGYHSKLTALFTKHGASYHNGCDCQAVPVWPGDNIRDISPNIDTYQDIYYRAAEAADTGDARAILSEMRKIQRADDQTPVPEPGGGSGGDDGGNSRGGGRVVSSGDYDPRITPAVRTHILDGDNNGGGHRGDSTARGKTLFPQEWTDAQIMSAVLATLHDPYTTSDDHEHLRDPNILNNYGIVDGVRVAVRLDRANNIITAHPLDGSGIVRNSRRAGDPSKSLPLGSVRNVPLPHGPDSAS